VKQIKMFGLAALAALMAMAFVGASSAMATGSTALCATEASPCASPITTIHETSVGKAKLLSTLPTIECNVLFSGTAANGGLGQPLVINGVFKYSSCNNFCTVEEVKGTEAKIEVLKTATELASVNGEGEVHVTCPFINCVYNGEGLEGDARGPLNSPASANGSVVISGQETNKVSGSCPEAAFLDITTTPLSATYISS
jgi:hypothetical protein